MARIVVLGDSITDGLTYPHLLKKAFTAAGYKEPVVINAGIGGNRAADMSIRLQRDVIDRRPSLVLVSAGVNDSIDVDVTDYQRHIRSIVDRLRTNGVPVVLLTPSLVRCEDNEQDERSRRLKAFREILRDLSKEHGLRLAEVNLAMQRSRARGLSQWGEDGIHLDFEGYRALVKAILDSLGFPEVAVPEELQLEPAEGLIREWEICPLHPDCILRDGQEAEEAASGAWQPLSLPQREINANWYWDLVRQLGFACGLTRQFGAETLLARSTFTITRPQSLFLTAMAEGVWLRDAGGAQTKIEYPDQLQRGWHPHPRARVDLAPGQYTLLLSCRDQFFAALTPEDNF